MSRALASTETSYVVKIELPSGGRKARSPHKIMPRLRLLAKPERGFLPNSDFASSLSIFLKMLFFAPAFCTRGEPDAVQRECKNLANRSQPLRIVKEDFFMS